MQPAATGSYRELRGIIRQAGLLDKQPRFYAAHLGGTMALIAAAVVAVVLIGDLWWNLALAPAFAIISSQLAFVGHDGAHRQIFRSIRKNDFAVIALSGLFMGFSLSWWMDSHNRHHAWPNHEAKDPDIQIAPFAFSDRQVGRKHGLMRWFVRYQAVLVIPLNTLGVVSKQIASVRFMNRKRGALRHPVLEPLVTVMHWSAYFSLLFIVMSPPLAVAFFALHYAGYGLAFGAVISPNHKGMPMVRADDPFDFLYLQVLTARNLRGGRLIDLLYGGLNYQIEHHLFPNMPRNRLPAAVPIVKAYCAQHRIPYHQTGVIEGYREILRSMHRVSTPLRGSDPGDSPITLTGVDMDRWAQSFTTT
jgi:fatty acid desaturase